MRRRRRRRQRQEQRDGQCRAKHRALLLPDQGRGALVEPRGPYCVTPRIAPTITGACRTPPSAGRAEPACQTSITIRDLLSARRADTGVIRKEIVVSLTPSRHLPERPSLEQLRKQARTSRRAARRRSGREARRGAARAGARVPLRELADAGTPRRVAPAGKSHAATRRAAIRRKAAVVAGPRNRPLGADPGLRLRQSRRRSRAHRQGSVAGARPLHLSQAPLLRRSQGSCSTSRDFCSSTITTRWICGSTTARWRLRAIAATWRWSGC